MEKSPELKSNGPLTLAHLNLTQLANISLVCPNLLSNYFFICAKTWQMLENIFGGRSWQLFFFLKDQTVNILGFVGHMISIAMTQGNRCSRKAAINNMETDRCGCIPVKLLKRLSAWMDHTRCRLHFLEPVLCVLSCVQLFMTKWTEACLAPLSMEFSRQEYWRTMPFLIGEDLPNSGVQPMSVLSPALANGFFTTSITWEAQCILCQPTF